MKNKKKCIVILSFILNNLFFYGQNINVAIDSLLNDLRTKSFFSVDINDLNSSDTIHINTLNRLSKKYVIINNYNLALKYAKIAKQASEKLNYKKGTAASLNIWGDIFWYKGEYVLSNDCYLKAMKISELLDDKPSNAISNRNLGWVYLDQKNYVKAIDFFNKSLQINLELNNKNGLSMIYSDLGITYRKKGDKVKAISYHLKALKISTETGNNRHVATDLGNIGSNYNDLGDFKLALDYHLKAEKVLREIGNKHEESLNCFSLGHDYLSLNKLEQAMSYLLKSMVISKEIGYKSLTKNTYNILAELYEKQNNFKQAYEYHKLYSDLKDSLLNEESSKQITEMNAKYESEKKEKEIELLTKDKELQSAEISKQKLIRNGTIGGLVIAMLFGFVLLNRFRVTNMQKKIIEHQNSQIVESINYSKKIQDSLLPSVSQMQQAFPSLFVFNSSKDIVSGDFYYFKEIEKYIVIACVDCTGHGVPGGFMSTLGSLLLGKIVDSGVLQPSEILLKLSDEIIRVLHQQNGGDIQDGMDLSVCLVDKENNTLEFSGARNGIVIVSNNEASRYKANPLPVGGNYMKKGVPITRNFQTEKIQLQPSDWVYMYTDGFMEQSGGVGSVPMTSAEFESKLLLLSQQSTENKIFYLQSELDVWRGTNERADDVLVIGLQVL